MTAVFITGDRAAAPSMAMMVAIEMLRAVAAGDTIETGDNRGVEAQVRAIALETGIEVDVTPTPRNSDDERDWDARHATLEARGVRSVVFVHADPMASRIGESLMRTLPDEALSLVTGAL